MIDKNKDMADKICKYLLIGGKAFHKRESLNELIE